MIFHPVQCEQILGLRQPVKTQTRRLKKPGEELIHGDVGIPVWVHSGAHNAAMHRTIGPGARFVTGKTLAVQPGHAKAIGRTPPIREIREERLGHISEGDCRAEGIDKVRVQAPHLDYGMTWALFVCPVCGKRWERPQAAFACLWECCGGRWERDKDARVWVLDWVDKRCQQR